MATDGTALEVFFLEEVKNNLPQRKLLPGLIQAEDFYYSKGIQTETTSDTGGGLNVGYFDAGDYLDYLVDVSETGDFAVKYRVASYQQAGKIELQMIGESTIVLHEVILPVTGGWQTWTTVSKDVVLTKGEYLFRIYVKTAGFNLNWIEFVSHVGINDGAETDLAGFNIFPNPNNGRFGIDFAGKNLSDFSVQIFNNFGQIVFDSKQNKTENLPLEIDLSDKNSGIYFINIIEGRRNRSTKFFIIK
jgi:hypothetical protein